MRGGAEPATRTPTVEERQQQSQMDRSRRARQIKVEVVENGAIVTNLSTNKDYVCTSLDEVLDHIGTFYTEKRQECKL